MGYGEGTERRQSDPLASGLDKDETVVSQDEDPVNCTLQRIQGQSLPFISGTVALCRAPDSRLTINPTVRAA